MAMNDAFHKFTPLTDAERVAVPAVAEEHDDGKHVSPIPADAPDVPKTHPRFGRPTATSVYRDEQGRNALGAGTLGMLVGHDRN